MNFLEFNLKLEFLVIKAHKHDKCLNTLKKKKTLKKKTMHTLFLCLFLDFKICFVFTGTNFLFRIFNFFEIFGYIKCQKKFNLLHMPIIIGSKCKNCVFFTVYVYVY